MDCAFDASLWFGRRSGSEIGCCVDFGKPLHSFRIDRINRLNLLYTGSGVRARIFGTPPGRNPICRPKSRRTTPVCGEEEACRLRSTWAPDPSRFALPFPLSPPKFASRGSLTRRRHRGLDYGTYTSLSGLDTYNWHFVLPAGANMAIGNLFWGLGAGQNRLAPKVR